MDNFHSVLNLLLNMVPPSVESMSHSSSTSKDKDGNDDKINLKKMTIFQRSSYTRRTVIVCIYKGGVPGAFT